MAVISQIKATSDNVDYNIRDDYSTWGGRNLLRNTKFFTASDLVLARATVPENGTLKLTPTTTAAYAKFKVNYLDYLEYNSIGNVTLSFEARTFLEGDYEDFASVVVYIGFNVASRLSNVFSSSYDKYKGVTLISSLEPLFSPINGNPFWTHCSYTVNIPTDLTTGPDTALVEGSNLTVQIANGKNKMPSYIRNIKLEIGNKATDWSPAPEDVARFIGNETIELYSE